VGAENPTKLLRPSGFISSRLTYVTLRTVDVQLVVMPVVQLTYFLSNFRHPLISQLVLIALGKSKPEISNNVGPVNSYLSTPLLSNNVGPVNSYLSRPLRPLRRVVFEVRFDLCIDDHGWPIINRSVSVRPKHLFDPYFDHD
jgi:hypothetical protein